ncbi:DGQHR domain-containing protein [Mesorhizobium sp. M0977]|uniref:DGQHR domain-containing protein n=1 Tax=Mesorhizobium sp. M0977 TaxID=2957039 RepID=UPI0033375131
MEYAYQAFVFHQRADDNGPLLALFHAPAGEVSAWADVDRLAHDNRLGPQREPKKSRINSIRRFFADDPQNTIPTAIVVGLRGVQIIGDGAVRTLRFETQQGQPHPGLIIDGQHRMRGLEAADPNTIVPIVGIIEASDLEMAFQFLVINNKSAKVPPDHLRALALNYSAEQLEARLKTARLALNPNLGSVGVLDEEPESPFRGMVAWPNNPPEQQIIVPAAIEAMASEAKSLGFGELEDLDSLNAFLIAMWTVIKEEWAHLFVANSKLLSKVGLTCMTQFVCSTIKTWARNPRLRDQVDPGDPEKVRSVTSDVLATLDPKFFEADWASTSYDTRAGRDLVMADLETLSFNVANGEPWYQGLKVIDRSWLQQALADAGGAVPPARDEV